MKKILISLSAALLVVLDIFVFGPFNIYQGNVDEFSIPLRSILSTFLLPAMILLLLLSLPSLMLSWKAHQVYVSILSVLGVLLWLQGNFLVWKYGLLDGQGIDWSIKVWRGWADAALWAALLTMACLFFRKIYPLIARGSIALACLLLVSLLITSFQKPEIWASRGKSLDRLIPAEKIFEFSPEQNVIHFVLDSFRSDLFEEIVTENMERYSKSLEGFTFFKEAIGTFPTTYMSVPAYLSGRIYKNRVPMQEFVKQSNRGRTLARWLHNRGYETDLVASLRFTEGEPYSVRYRIAVPYSGTTRQYLRSNAAAMLDMSLFRQVPHFLKRFIYNDERWLVQRLSSPRAHNLSLSYFSHQAFLDDMIKRLSATRRKPVYKYIHLVTTHPPIVVDKECQYAQGIPKTRESIKVQDRCSLDHLIKVLDKLRSEGLYDSSLIILQADHGLSGGVDLNIQGNLDEEGLSVGGASLAEIASSAAVLLAIKPPHSQGPLKISRAQVALTDIRTTISSLLNVDKTLAGRSAYTVGEDEERERRFYFYQWRNENWQSAYFPRLDEFIIKGSVFDRNSWRWNRTYYPPTRSN